MSEQPMTTPDPLEAVKQAVIDDLKPLAARVQTLIDAAVTEAVKADRHERLLLMNEWYKALDGLPEKAMSILDAITSLRSKQDAAVAEALEPYKSLLKACGEMMEYDEIEDCSSELSGSWQSGGLEDAFAALRNALAKLKPHEPPDSE